MLKTTKKQKKEIYQSKEYKHFVILRMISFVFIALFLVAIGISSSFIYKNIFDTISQADIIILSNAPSTEVINFIKYDKVKKSWEEKNRVELINIEKDPFNIPFVPTEEDKIE